MSENQVLFQKLSAMQVACIKAQVANRDQLMPLIDRLRQACGAAAVGPVMAIFHGGASKEGFVVEVAAPVSEPVNEGEVYSRLLEAASALTLRHMGSHQTIRETVLKIYADGGKLAGTTGLLRREIYTVLDAERPENNITEVQVLMHEWDNLLAEGAEKVLGAEARSSLMQGIESIPPNTPFEAYLSWLEGAMTRLDTLTDDEEKKCQVVSRCAHVFPQERIDLLRSIYEKGGIDEVLREMYTDYEWYENPVRRGNVLYMRKIPYDPEAYARAETPAERRKAYCHCRFVHPYLDEIPARLSTTFCYCGAGWYRRLWEGILGRPVKIQHVETLLRGHDQCTLTITLPLELDGECSPETEKK